MANHKRALHHHGKAGSALRKGDSKLAAKHLGHALAALRASAPAGLPEPDADQQGGPSDMDQDNGQMPQGQPAPNPMAGLRARLASFGK